MSRRRVNRFDDDEKALLEERFKSSKTPTSFKCEEIASEINQTREKNKEKGGTLILLTGKQIKFWFDHRRRIENHGTYKPLKPGSRSAKKALKPSPQSVKIAKPQTGYRNGLQQLANHLPRHPGMPSTSVQGDQMNQMTSLPHWMHSFQLLPLMSTMKYTTFPPGTIIIKNGEISDDLYFLLKGNVRVSDLNNNEIALLKQGSFFGEMGVIDRGPRTATVTAATHFHSFVMSGEVARDMLQCEPVVSKDIVDQATCRLLE